MNLLKIAARVAAGEGRVPGGMGRLTMHLHIDEEDEHYEALANDDGTISSEFSQVVSQLGGEVEDWESTGMSISIPEGSQSAWEQHLEEMAQGKYGPGAKMVAEAYGLEGFTDEDGNDVGGEPEEDPGPPSDPGPPWDTLEEKRGEK